MKKFLLFAVCFVLSAAWVRAGDFCDWVVTEDAEQSGAWDDTTMWSGGAVPTADDAARFTVPAGVTLTVDFSSAPSEISVTNLWILGGGTVKFTMPSTTTMKVTAFSSTSNVFGGGRTAMAIRGGSTFILEGGNLLNVNSSNYNHIQMSGTGTSLVVRGGARFDFDGRIGADGSTNVSADAGSGMSIIVEGEGTAFNLAGDVGGTDTLLVVRDGALLEAIGSMAKTVNAKVVLADSSYVVQNTTQEQWLVYGTGMHVYATNAVLNAAGPKMGGTSSQLEYSNCQITVTGTDMRFTGATDTTLTLRDGTVLTTTALSNGYRTNKNSGTVITNATLNVSGNGYIGANGGKDKNGANEMFVEVQNDGVLNMTGSSTKLYIGNWSTNDVLFVNGGTVNATGEIVLGNAVTEGPSIRIAGESSRLICKKNIYLGGASSNSTFSVSLDVVLPISTDPDDAAIQTLNHMWVRSTAELNITIPKGLGRGTYALWKSTNVKNEVGFTNENIHVTGGSAKVIQDGSSILIRVIPTSGTKLLVY